MVRLHITVEGQTEEAFVRKLLVPHLAEQGVYADVRCTETGHDTRGHRRFRGGLINYAKARRDLMRWMSQDPGSDAWFTTMFDLYALPNDFPGRPADDARRDPYDRVFRLHAALEQDVAHPRFVAYLQLHEFEALLLSEPRSFLIEYPGCARQVAALETLAGSVDSPERIDDGRETAPSKRILALIPDYKKVVSGAIIAESIGLDVLRARCPHFHEWLTRLEKLNA